VLAVLVTGCVGHAGASIGVRSSGKVAIGWNAGAGTFAEATVGQSWAGGRATSYAAVHGWYPVGWDRDNESIREIHLGATLGAGYGPKGAGLVAGLDGRMFSGDQVRGDTFRGAAALIGVRWLGTEGELYLGLEAMQTSWGSGD